MDQKDVGEDFQLKEISKELWASTFRNKVSLNNILELVMVIDYKNYMP